MQDTDRNMLLGILALQMDFITRDQLIAGMDAWVRDKKNKLDEILLGQGALQQDTHALLVALVAKHLEMHEGDVEKSLASLSSIGSLQDELNPIADPEVAATLSMVSANRAADDSNATTSQVVGASSSTGARFRILRPHASGGLGEVSIAHDDELNREVALKEIQERFADDDSSRSRFVLEAEVTGGLEHPGIVPVYGLGQYADGRPFYAMRFIRGDSLKEAVDRFHKAVQLSDSDRTLELRKLLRRFVDVCNAVAYAHSRGVLHRDLKPGNIMLGKYGETLVVDWGLAKLKDLQDESPIEDEASLKPRSGSSIAFTQMGSAVGTPAYMAPEQAGGKLGELGPASDVYSLGATLYYLLTGKMPFAGDDLGEVLKKVEGGDFAPPRALTPDIPKPLESICLKAMETAPNDRYASPQELADNVERFLADEPIMAYREPLVVRTRRWMRKHPRIVAALASTVMVGLISIVVIAAVVSAKNQELAVANTDLDRANRKLNDRNADLAKANQAEREAREEAETRRAEAEAVLDFFEDKVLAAARPEDQEGGLGIDATIRAAVDAAEPQIADSFVDQPLVEASVRRTLGMTYYLIGKAELAIQQLEQARELRTTSLGPQDYSTISATNDLANAYQAAGRIAEAIPLFEEGCDRLRNVVEPDNRETLVAMSNLAVAYQAAGRLDESTAILKETLSLSQDKLGPDHRSTLKTMNNLALTLHTAGRLDEAVPLYEEALNLKIKKLGPEHPETLLSMNNLANAYFSVGRADEAIQILEKTNALLLKKLGPEHPHTLVSMGNLANAYSSAGSPEKAQPILETTLKQMRETLGAEHPYTIVSMQSLATTYLENGHLELAVALFDEFLAAQRSLGKDENPQIASLLAQFGLELIEQQKYAKAESYLVNCLNIRKKTMADSWLLFNAQSVLGGAFLGQGSLLLADDKESALNKFTQAEPLLLDGYEGMKQREETIPDPGRIRLTEAVQRIVDLYAAWDKPDEAAKWQPELDKRLAEAEKSEAEREEKSGTTEKPKTSKPQVDEQPEDGANENKSETQ